MIHRKSYEGKPRKVISSFEYNTRNSNYIVGMVIFSSKYKKLLGIIIDNKLTFEHKI